MQPIREFQKNKQQKLVGGKKNLQNLIERFIVADI